MEYALIKAPTEQPQKHTSQTESQDGRVTLHMVIFNVLIQTLCDCELFRSSFLKTSSNSMEISLCILRTLGSDMILS